ncbi:response regulator [Crocinitomix catalasitica]|uniref:response regulator n=1 Tax=Crocinitomix catalasitica TaxID=184607 RepID=UPI0004837646|nr:response regulator [Crocinitomix catalasitica]
MKKFDLACLIDDDEIFAFGAKRIIEMSEICNELKVFNNGQEAIDFLVPSLDKFDDRPVFILLDLNMPIMDGWEFLDSFTALAPKRSAIIYLITSSIDPADLKKAHEYSSVSNYIVKPITKEGLLETLSSDFE